MPQAPLSAYQWQTPAIAAQPSCPKEMQRRRQLPSTLSSQARESHESPRHEEQSVVAMFVAPVAGAVHAKQPRATPSERRHCSWVRFEHGFGTHTPDDAQKQPDSAAHRIPFRHAEHFVTHDVPSNAQFESAPQAAESVYLPQVGMS